MNRKKTFQCVMILMATMLLFDCCGRTSSSDGSAIPRRRAYPRITLYDSVFAAVPECPLHFEANCGATLSGDSTPSKNGESSFLLDIYYPRYDATVYCTFTKVDTTGIDAVISNRIERISLNSGGLASELTEFSNEYGFDSHILTTSEAAATPLQFFSTDNQRWVVSGAMYMKNASGGSPDSIAPIIKGVEQDMVHALKTLKYE